MGKGDPALKCLRKCKTFIPNNSASDGSVMHTLNGLNVSSRIRSMSICANPLGDEFY